MKTPKGTRLVINRDYEQIFVIEHPPQHRQIFFHGDSFHLAFPWLVFVVYLRTFPFYLKYPHKMSVFANQKPIASLYDRMGHMPMPNGSDTVCLGTAKPRWFYLSANRAVAEMLDKYWSSRFTAVGQHGVFQRKVLELGEWQTLSITRPNFIMEDDYKCKQINSLGFYVNEYHLPLQP